MRGAPITAEDHKQVQELHAAGLGRNAIARKMGRAPETVGRIAKQLGLTFDRVVQDASIKAMSSDAKMLRQREANELLRMMEEMRNRFGETVSYYNMTIQGDVVEADVKANPRDMKDLAAAYDTLLRSHLRLVAADADTAGVSEVAKWLDWMRGRTPADD